MPSKLWYPITYPFPNFNGATVEVWEWTSNLIPHSIMDVISYPCWNLILSILIKKGPFSQPGHYLNQWWLGSRPQNCLMRPQWVNTSNYTKNLTHNLHIAYNTTKHIDKILYRWTIEKSIFAPRSSTCDHEYGMFHSSLPRTWWQKISQTIISKKNCESVFLLILREFLYIILGIPSSDKFASVYIIAWHQIDNKPLFYTLWPRQNG